MLTKPNQKLFITMPRVDSSGKAVNPSYLVELLSKMFTDVKLKEIEDFDSSDRLLSKHSAVNYLIELINRAATYGLDNLDEKQLSLLGDWVR